MNILFITARLPYPPLKGDQVRGYHQIRLLSQQHKITLLSFVESEYMDSEIDALRPYCQQILTVKSSLYDKL